MGTTAKRALTIGAGLWIVIGTVYYCFVFVRDFYAANQHAIHTTLERIGF